MKEKEFLCRAAIAAMQGIITATLTNENAREAVLRESKVAHMSSEEYIATLAVRHANALAEEADSEKWITVDR